MIVSSPALALAASIASRSEQSASQALSLVSSVLVTLKVAAQALLVSGAATKKMQIAAVRKMLKQRRLIRLKELILSIVFNAFFKWFN